jgi:signal transduction histidine kinase
MDQSAFFSQFSNRTSRLAWILCAMVSIGALINAVLFVKGLPANLGFIKLATDLIGSLLPIFFAIVAALIVSHQPRNRIGWLLMTPAIVIVVVTPIDLQMNEFNTAPEPTISNLLFLWFQNWSWLFYIFPLLLILLLFPTGSPPSPRWRWIVHYATGKMIYFILLVTFIQNISDINDRWTLSNPIGFIPDEPWVAAVLITPWIVSLGLLTILCAASLFVRYRRAPTVERLQIKWLLFAAGIFVVCYVPLVVAHSMMSSTGQGVADLLLELTVPLFPIAICIAILRYRLYEIDIIINRTLVYGSLTALVIGFYVVVVGYLGSLLRAENNLLISLFATGLVAVIFQPLRDRLQRGVNRLMYGRRDEPVTVLSQLGAQLEQTLLPDEILPGLANTVAQTLKLPYAAIALKVGDDYQIQAESGHASGNAESFPLVYQGETIGQLLAARRAPAEDFNPADRLLLTNIARQAGAVAYSVRLNTALQQSRQQLVTAREEERRRLRRDLHDGLGPQLASQTLTIDAIYKLLDRDPTAAEDLLVHLKAQSQAAIQDIRRLVYDLRPPALDELGLVEALREGVKKYGPTGKMIEVIASPDPLPVLPAAVEVAIYRIAQEAITNVVRHAQAQRCNVSILVQDHHLDLTIADDGKGHPANFRFGVGLNSMRERAEELGGHIDFDNQPAGGMRVQVWLPLPKDEE